MTPEPDEILFGIEIFAQYIHENPAYLDWQKRLRKHKAKVKKDPHAPDVAMAQTPGARRTGKTEYWFEALPLDYSTIPQALDCLETMKKEARDFLVYPEPGKLRAGTSVEVWIGRRDQFIPLWFCPGKLVARRGGDQALNFDGAQLTAEEIAATLDAFDTREGRERAAERQHRIESAAQESTILRESVNVRRPLSFTK